MDTKLLDLERDPEFKRASEKLQELGERRGNLQRRKDELIGLLLLRDDAKARGERLIADDPAQDLRPNKAAMREELSQVDSDLEATEEALRLLRERLGDLRRQKSHGICQTLRPEYAKIAARMLHALRELAAVNQEEIEFIDQLERNGLTLYLERCVVSQFGTLADPQSMVSFRIRQIEQDYPEVKQRKVA